MNLPFLPLIRTWTRSEVTCCRSSTERLNHTILGVLVVACFVFLTSTAHGIVTSDESGSHVVAPGGSAFGIDLTGVASLGFAPLDGISDDHLRVCTGSLITSHHVLTAAHCVDGVLSDEWDGVADEELILFGYEALFETSDGDVRIPLDISRVTMPPQWPDGQADLAIVTLSEPAPAAIPRYPIYNGRSELGQTVILAGFGDPGHGSTGEEIFAEPRARKRAGLNRMENITQNFTGEVDGLIYDFDSGLPEHNALAIMGFESDLGFGEDEVGLALGDSGGPLFLTDGTIVGVMIIGEGLPEFGDATSELDGSWGELGVSLRLSPFEAFLSEATDGQAMFVPEPSALLLLSFGTLGIGLSRTGIARNRIIRTSTGRYDVRS